MPTSGDLLRQAVEAYEIPKAALSANVAADSPGCHPEDCDWLVQHFLDGKGTPIVVADAVIKCIVDLKRKARLSDD